MIEKLEKFEKASLREKFNKRATIGVLLTDAVLAGAAMASSVAMGEPNNIATASAVFMSASLFPLLYFMNKSMEPVRIQNTLADDAGKKALKNLLDHQPG
jgi:hypothetical protein